MKNRPEGGLFARDLRWHPPAYAPGYKTSVKRSPTAPLVSLKSTRSEETGPVFTTGLLGEHDNDLVINFAKNGEKAIGEQIIVHGQVLDQAGRPQAGTLVEFWQANAGGRYRHKKDGYQAPLDPNFGGCGRTITDENGWYWFRTVRPGAYPWPNTPNEWRPAHIHFGLFGQSFGQRLITQMYFEGDPSLRFCPILKTIPTEEGIDLLCARLDMGETLPMDARAWRFDITLRGRRQTPFENRMEGL